MPVDSDELALFLRLTPIQTTINHHILFESHHVTSPFPELVRNDVYINDNTLYYGTFGNAVRCLQ